MKQYFGLNKDVFIVEGIKNHAIYDLAKGKLYHIDDEFLKFIRKLIYNPKWNFDNFEKSNVNLLKKNNIIAESDKLEKEESILSLRDDRKPYFAWIEITQQRNFKCVFCYEESNCNIKKFMTMEDFYKAIDFLMDQNIKEIQFIGGEPMIHPKLKEMIEYCLNKKYFNFIEIYTNASFITQEWCDFFKKNNIKVAVSFHSYIPEEFDKITQTKGSYKLARRGLELLLKNKIDIRVAAITNKNVRIGDKPDSFDIKLSTQAPRLTGRGNFNQLDFDMFEESVITESSFSRPIGREYIKKLVSGHQCFNKDLYIAYNLEVFPCVMERRISHGFITGDKEKDINLVKSHICHYNKDCIDECKHCEFRYACYDCRPNSNGKHISEKPWRCSYNPRTGKWEDVKKMYNRLKKEG